MLCRNFRHCVSLLTASALLLLVTPCLHSFVQIKSGGWSAEAADKEKDPKKKKEKDTRKLRPKKPAAKKEENAKPDPAAFERPDESHTVGVDDEGKADVTADVFVDRAIDAVIVLDASGSMKRTDPNRVRDRAAKLFARFLTARDRIAIVEFDREVRTLLPLTPVTPENLLKADEAIDRVSVEGRFTDLEAPLESALKVLQDGEAASSAPDMASPHGSRAPDSVGAAEPDKNRVRAVLLLSDGKMDPHPSRGTAAQLIERMFAEDLPRYREQNVTLYSVGLGEESDRKLLREMSDATGGLHWAATNVNTVHLGFSDLFLALRKPQVTPIEKGGFTIDPSVTEATFYVTRQNENENVTLISPAKKRIESVDLVPDIKWFRGSLFDIITISKPQPGRWAFEGIENPEGFATLVTDLKLQVKWPSANLRAGETVVLSARLTEKGETLERTELKETAFFTYKVVSTSTGEEVAAGSLLDNGEGRDKTANDFVYSGETKIAGSGDLKAFVGVVTPTFTRQQVFPITIVDSLINLTLLEKDPFLAQPQRFRVSLGKEVGRWKESKVTLLARNEQGRCFVSLKQSEDNPLVYEGAVSALPPGVFELRARLEGEGPKGKPYDIMSDPLSVTSDGPGECEFEVVTNLVDQSSNFASLLIAVCGSFLWCIFLARKALSEGKRQSREIARVIPYTQPETLVQRLELLRARASEQRREATDLEIERFALVPKALKTPRPVKRPSALRGEVPTSAADSAAKAVEPGGDTPPEEHAPVEPEPPQSSEPS